jgi:hypothetical protein
LLLSRGSGREVRKGLGERAKRKEDSPCLREERKISDKARRFLKHEIAFTKRSVALINVACHRFPYP